MSSGAHGGGPIQTEQFWSTDLHCLVKVHSGPTKQWLYLTVETGPRAPACGDLTVTQKSMRSCPEGCRVQAESRSRQLIPLPHFLEDAGLSCWQTLKARRWSFAKTKARVRLDYETRQGRRRPVTGPPVAPGQAVARRCSRPEPLITGQLLLFISPPSPLPQAA